MPMVAGFLPSTSGLHFANSFLSVPLFTVDIAGAQVPIGDASNGLCGGMIYTARDYYEAGAPPPPDTASPSSGLLFDYLVGRLFESFNLPLGPTKYLYLMNPALPDHETVASNIGLAPRGRAWVMINEEWPKIKADLDGGTLCPLGLIRLKSTDPFRMGENHQVLAYGYDLTGTDLEIHVYDPNHNDKDDVILSLSIADPQHTTTVTQSTGEPIWCFFRTDYAASPPPLVFQGPPFPPGEVVWVEDALPAGAAPSGGAEAWTWIGTDPLPRSGRLAHQSPTGAGTRQHYFSGTTNTLAIQAGDMLFAYAHLEPSNPPSEVMLQWNDGSWEHRAYWGQDQIGWGAAGTQSRWSMGPLPVAGQWVRLDVPASAVGLEGRTLSGIAFTRFGGRVAWDRAGRVPGTARQLRVVTTPHPVPVGTPVAVTVHAVDSQTGAPIAGTARIQNPDQAAQEFPTNAPFTFTFQTHTVRRRDPDGLWEIEIVPPTGSVTAPGYPESVRIDFGV